jgi:2-methylisocitrate lyase-like PEP mutase family enzyme
MTGPSQVERAEALRALHRGPSLLLLPNAWDAMSARVFAASGFAAVATTSAGMAWALGYPDGEQAPWPDLVAATARVVRAAGVPVTADIEAGYGATTEQLAASVTDIVSPRRALPSGRSRMPSCASRRPGRRARRPVCRW